MAGKLVRFRKGSLDQRDTFRIVLSPRLTMECLTCDEPVEWVPEEALWKCPSCETPLSLAAASDLVFHAQRTLELFVNNGKPLGRWRRIWEAIFS